MEIIMKCNLACKPVTPIPEPQSPTHRGAAEGLESGKVASCLSQCGTNAHLAERLPLRRNGLGQIVKVVGSWFIPTALRDEALQAVDACEIEAWERHIRKITDEHRFTGFPC
jgi:hypothetical protein